MGCRLDGTRPALLRALHKRLTPPTAKHLSRLLLLLLLLLLPWLA